MNISVTTEPDSEVTGEDVASNLFPVLGVIVDTGASIGEACCSAANRALCSLTRPTQPWPPQQKTNHGSGAGKASQAAIKGLQPLEHLRS